MTGPSVTRGAAGTLAAWLARATERLRSAGVASPRADAEQLAAFALGISRARLVVVDELPPSAAERLDELVARRARREPLQHLTGLAGFRYLDLAVGPGVFIPRPETESVVGWALAALPSVSGGGPVCVDLCAGSGAIALSLAGEVPGARVHAVEVDPAALGWLRRNVAASGLPVTVHEADVTAPPIASLARLAGSVDLVVSNPPYLPDADRDEVEPEVGEHDPPRALWGGADGLDVVRAVVALAARLLRPGGLLAVEHADGHGVAAPGLLRADGRWAEVADHPDLAGRDRFVTGRRRAGAGQRATGEEG
ncbi:MULTISPECIES: peptide chain release factor N(5)-glutamine methyltransferase [Frankia]|uniref:Release factor glutamine methyltransferase n=1 Tax=Frankia alni (strain DSM 45986 / CECT 9034 / ACN14a) TaxID=326424 RepID=Q0RDA1_FRAAA|nr:MULTISPECIES: peptide chain release factor N(5)-glutamine methyltransferase [Frankia]CAJ64569.1 N5-glutamine methyltransferase, modifies release factors RF-1 and RF-2 [Frankia alni ACN14a]